jgi:NitT/TauT family transport system permease protein
MNLLPLREEIPRRYYLLASGSLLTFLLLAWSVVTYGGLVDPIFLPTPGAILNAAILEIQDGTLWADVQASVYRVTVGWLIATLFAVPIGILMGNFKLFEGLFEPPIDLVRYMPAVAFVPLTILWAGVGDTQKFVILFIGTFFQEVLMIADNVKSVPKDLIHVSYTFGLNKWETTLRVVAPYSAPGMLDTLRITLGWAWTYLVVAEMVRPTGPGLYHYALATIFADRQDHSGDFSHWPAGADDGFPVQISASPPFPLGHQP